MFFARKIPLRILDQELISYRYSSLFLLFLLLFFFLSGRRFKKA